MSGSIAGLIVDLLMRTCNATSVERQAFTSGSRYMVRFYGEHHMEVHIVNKDERLFAEFWIPTYATPIMIIEYFSHVEPQEICREICDMVHVMHEAMRAGKSTEGDRATLGNRVYHPSPP
ncbi:hypothetical protein [Vulcanisaeta thermophila]|uniref:hypothetical protein n=1 Tax=Vulcanisaeta thermophila TaxID=867917 RepID=UPI000852FC01|nr:hypothetical protein [Vulcanisaeta thermophila]